jgi:peptidoglycan/xylan/chitin deacetylase (PgdA/CDA1 family)
MRRITAIACAIVLCVTASSALAGECANPNALGTSRTLAIDNTSHLKLGSQQYNETLPLADHEVVLTFDDGPLGPYTTRILDLLAAECVKATYFLVGTMAQSQPALVKRIQREGHTLGTHSRSHPLTFDRMPVAEAENQIDGGIAMVQAALGDQGKLAPFFRIPGLMRSSAVENVLAQRSLVTWSVDLVADDWYRGITADDIAKRALRRLDERGRGILLLHDIHPATALAMPRILKGLKERGFRIVHVVPASPNQPKTYSEPQQWASYAGKRSRVVLAEGSIDPRRPVPSRESLDLGVVSISVFKTMPEVRHVMAAAGDDMKLPRGLWSSEEDQAVIPITMAPFAPGADAIDWPQQDRLTASVSTQEIKWPVVKPVPVTTRAAEPSKKTASPKQHGRPGVNACKDRPSTTNLGPPCKKPPVGHQLSLGEAVPPEGLRSLYQF